MEKSGHVMGSSCSPPSSSSLSTPAAHPSPPQSLQPFAGSFASSSGAAAAPVFLSQQLPFAHLLDTLPYIDPLSPEQHEAAKLLVQQEMAAIRRERSSSSSDPQQQQAQQREAAEDETASAAAAVGGRAAAGKGGGGGGGAAAAAGGRNKEQTVTAESGADADSEERVLQSYLVTFPLPATPHLDDPNTLAGRELARLARGESMQKLDLSRYETLPSAPTAGTKAQESEWRKSVDCCEGLLEHLGVGQTNLELMNLHAVSLWMRHLHGLNLNEQHWSAAVKRVRGEVDRVSKQRKLDQVECSSSLRDTARMREDYEHRNAEILAALGKLQQEVVELKLRCHDRGVLPDDYDSDFEEDLDDWEALVTSPPPPAPATRSTTNHSSSHSSSNSSTDSNNSSANSSSTSGSNASRSVGGGSSISTTYGGNKTSNGLTGSSTSSNNSRITGVVK